MILAYSRNICRFQLSISIKHQLRCFSNTLIRSNIESSDSSLLISQWHSNISAYSETCYDTITPTPIQLLNLTLDRPSCEVLPSTSTPVHPNYHLAYFPTRVPERKLAFDGYSKTFAPPHPFSQRMWAGGELLFSKNPLRVGDNVKLIKKCSNVELKRSSRKQELVFVWEDRDFHNEKGWSLKDRRNLVYMKKEEGRANSTKIVKGCLVHGPLTCTLLLDLLRDNLPADNWINGFKYRAVNPLVVNEPFRVCGKKLERLDEKGDSIYEMWAETALGGVAMKGSATVNIN
ncbi:9522_t:CDS:2 [Paraglomus occultum]|uniref:9522_t:CDS:1 n=1 Tax=Paraglomus occultum TaxID=144539 RepID=A0A9N8ZI40_9GLOM|nr:9522_t:CDS:2 [Paraglomus occultum]